MKKSLGTLIIGMFLVVMLPMTVFAETDAGKNGWKVSFDGEKMESNFKSSQIDDEVFLLQPGDETEFHLALTNQYTTDTDWYMTNEVLKSLEDSQTVAEGGAYSYILTYIAPDGTEELLYSSEEVGGDTINASGEGLHQATNSLEDWFFLDTLGSGEQAEITLTVKLEGETQGNIYQDTLAKLQMNFAVELPNSPSTSKPHTIVQTGDDPKKLISAIVIFGIGVLCIVGVFVGKTHSRNDSRKKEVNEYENIKK